MVFPSILLVVCLALGAAFFWDIGGLAAAMRTRLEESSPAGASHKKLPNWTFRAIGIWCFVFGIGQFVILAALVR